MSDPAGRPAGLAQAAARAPAAGPRARWTGGLLFGAAGVIGFSGTVPATRVAAPVFGPLTVTFARIVIAAVLGAATLAAGRRLGWPGRSHLAGLLAMGLGLAVGYPLFLALAVQKVPASHAAVVIALVPAATAVLSAARNFERLPRPFWLACLTGLAAVTGYAATSGGASMFAASLAWYRGLAAGGTARIGQLNLAQPFLAIGWSALLLGEHITWPVPVTAAIVLCCMAVCLRSTPARGPSAQVTGTPGGGPP